MPAKSPLVAVYGNAESDRVWISSCLEDKWRVRSLRPSEPLGLQPDDQIVACVLVVDEEEEHAALHGTISNLVEADGTPVVSVSERPIADGQLWVHRAQAERVLSSLIESVARTAETIPPPAPKWRRKGDMIIGRTKPIRDLLRTLDLLAKSTASVLITGESGTGKELVARALHYSGPRVRTGQFVAINCAAIPENLFEAELFGYERGAFTGASLDKPGLFEAADGGTLFLDELGDMPMAIQAKFLRVLETSSVMRVGSTRSRSFDVRVVAATGSDLRKAMESGKFRQDLFFRINTYPIHVPPLRDRIEDIPAIVNHHIQEISARERREPIPIRPGALQKLLTYHWPGNVRELVNVVERAMLFASADGIDVSDVVLPEEEDQVGGGGVMPYREAKRRFEREYYDRLLRVAGGNVSRAAKLAQKTRKEIYQATERLGLNREMFRDTK